MRTKFIAFAGAALIATAGVAGSLALSGATAQSDAKAPVILIINQAMVISQSKAGQSVTPQLAKLQEAANKELNKEIEKIVKEGKDLEKLKATLSEEVWLQQANKVAIKQNNLPALREVKVRELSISEQKALGEITEEMKPILKKIVDARGATILLDRSAVMYASIDTDITQEVITELDKKITSVKVEKVDLAELQRKAQEAAKKQAGKK